MIKLRKLYYVFVAVCIIRETSGERICAEHYSKDIVQISDSDPVPTLETPQYHSIRHTYRRDTEDYYPNLCLLINYRNDLCGGISIAGDLMYNDDDGHDIDIYTQNKSETKGWRTQIKIKRVPESDQEEPAKHIYSMSFVSLYDYDIVDNVKMAETWWPTANWDMKFLNRFNGHYAIIRAEKENKYMVALMCKRLKRPENELTDTDYAAANIKQEDITDSNFTLEDPSSSNWREKNKYFLKGGFITVHSVVIDDDDDDVLGDVKIKLASIKLSDEDTYEFIQFIPVVYDIKTILKPPEIEVVIRLDEESSH